MKNKEDWAISPYNAGKIDGRYLISNFFGAWDLLDTGEFRQLNSFSVKEGSLLYNRLLEKGLILRKENLPKLIADYRNLNSHLFADTSLHIAVLTTRCNQSCRYCQTNTDKPEDMSFEVATKIIHFLLGVRNTNLTLEFQGGEPLLNWKILKFFTENLRKLKVNKNIRIVLVTNGLLLDEKKIDFFIKHNVGVAISIDGPQFIHDKNRFVVKGKGSYQKVMQAIKILKEAYRKKGIRKPLDILPTITKDSLNFPKEIIDEYIKLGAECIALRPINQIGIAQCNWQELGFSAEDFCDFWAKAMDYIIKMNKNGIHCRERIAEVILRKIFKKQYSGYVDLISPCGAGRGVLAYMPDGDIFPCDEARMAGNDIFKLGNILRNNYEEVIKSPNLFSICQASLMELWDYNSAYLPWIGTCPVLNYLCQNNIITKITAFSLYKIQRFQFEYMFKKISESRKNEDIFKGWLK